MQRKSLSSEQPACFWPNISTTDPILLVPVWRSEDFRKSSQHVGGYDNAKAAEMGEAPREEHLLLRWEGDDGPAEGYILPDPVPHHRNLLPLLRFRVSHSSSPQRSRNEHFPHSV